MRLFYRRIRPIKTKPPTTAVGVAHSTAFLDIVKPVPIAPTTPVEEVLASPGALVEVELEVELDAFPTIFLLSASSREQLHVHVGIGGIDFLRLFCRYHCPLHNGKDNASLMLTNNSQQLSRFNLTQV